MIAVVEFIVCMKLLKQYSGDLRHTLLCELIPRVIDLMPVYLGIHSPVKYRRTHSKATVCCRDATKMRLHLH